MMAGSRNQLEYRMKSNSLGSSSSTLGAKGLALMDMRAVSPTSQFTVLSIMSLLSGV